MRNTFRTVSVLILALFLFSCVKVISPKSTIEGARKGVESAKEEQASVYAPDHLEMCEKELSRAQQAYQDGNSQRANAWAKRAEVDSELTMLKAKNKRLNKEIENMKTD